MANSKFPRKIRLESAEYASEKGGSGGNATIWLVGTEMFSQFFEKDFSFSGYPSTEIELGPNLYQHEKKVTHTNFGIWRFLAMTLR